MKEQRAVVDFDSYIYFETEEQAIKLAKKIEKLVNDEFPDSLTKILSITVMPYGSYREADKKVIYPKN